MNQSDDREYTSLRDIFRVLFRQKWKASVTFLGVIGLVLLALSVWPRRFESEARLFVRLGRESVTLDPTATTGQIVAIQESRQNELRSAQDILESRALAEKVVDALGPEAILRKGDTARDRSSASRLISAAKGVLGAGFRVLGQPVLTPRERAVTLLQQRTDVHIAKNSNVISVAYLGYTSASAQAIAQALIDEYLREHVRINRNPGSYDFFRRQTELLEEQVDGAARMLRDAKNEIQVSSLATKTDLLERRVAELETNLYTIESRLSASTASCEALQNQIAQLPERLETQVVSGLPNAAGDNMREQLYLLEIKHQELTAKYTPDYPPLRAVDRQLQEARNIFGEQSLAKAQSMTAYNEVRRNLEYDLLKQQATVTSLEAERETLRQQQQATLADLKRLNADEMRIAQLEREYQMASNNLAAYSERLEQARIDQALQHERISNVNVLQAASFVEDPASPQLELTLALGLVIATVGAFSSVMLAEYFDRSLKSPDDIEQQLNLPVLISIPRLRARQVTLN